MQDRARGRCARLPRRLCRCRETMHHAVVLDVVPRALRGGRSRRGGSAQGTDIDAGADDHVADQRPPTAARTRCGSTTGVSAVDRVHGELHRLCRCLFVSQARRARCGHSHRRRCVDPIPKDATTSARCGGRARNAASGVARPSARRESGDVRRRPVRIVRIGVGGVAAMVDASAAPRSGCAARERDRVCGLRIAFRRGGDHRQPAALHAGEEQATVTASPRAGLRVSNCWSDGGRNAASRARPESSCAARPSSGSRCTREREHVGARRKSRENRRAPAD